MQEQLHNLRWNRWLNRIRTFRSALQSGHTSAIRWNSEIIFRKRQKNSNYCHRVQKRVAQAIGTLKHLQFQVICFFIKGFKFPCSRVNKSRWCWSSEDTIKKRLKKLSVNSRILRLQKFATLLNQPKTRRNLCRTTVRC